MNLFAAIGQLIKKIFSKDFEKKEVKNVENITSNTTLAFSSTTLAPTTSTSTTFSTTTTTTTTKKAMVTINSNTIKTLEEWEARRYTLYDDGAGFGTIGVGHAIFDKNEKFDGKLLINATLTDKEIDSLLAQDLAIRIKAEKQINEKINFSLTQNQFDAIVLFVFNTGTLWNVLSTAINTYGKYKDESALRKQWRYYNTSKGKIMAGLINRREAEVDLFLDQYKGRNYYDKSKTVNKKLIIGYY